MWIRRKKGRSDDFNEEGYNGSKANESPYVEEGCKELIEWESEMDENVNVNGMAEWLNG